MFLLLDATSPGPVNSWGVYSVEVQLHTGNGTDRYEMKVLSSEI